MCLVSVTFQTYRESGLGVDVDHASEQALAVGWDEVRDVEGAALHLLQQLAQVVVVEGQRAHQQGVQDDAARPDVRPTAVILLALKQRRSNAAVVTGLVSFRLL